MKSRGFVVHCYADPRKDRLYLLGRLEDGRSFAAAQTSWRPSFHIYRNDIDRVKIALSSIKYEICEPLLESFDGIKALLLLEFLHYREYNAAGKFLEQAGLASPDADLKPPDAFFIQRHIKGPVELEGEARPGRFVDLVFPDPQVHSVDDCKVILKIASVDIETDVENGTILAIGVSVIPDGNSFVRIYYPEAALSKSGEAGEPSVVQKTGGDGIFFHPTEASLLEAFLGDMRKIDPDVITGWNFLDFDFPQLAGRYMYHHIPFILGRSAEVSKFFPSSQNESGMGGTAGRRRSAAALVQGRQVIDALRVVRSGPRAGSNRLDTSSFTLEAVAQSVLGETKLITSTGTKKLEELKELYQKDPVMFGEYCRKDADLVLKILEKTGLFRLTMERASLTGVSLDKAWTSVVSFERIYGMELRRRQIAPPPADLRRSVSGAAGGTVLEPLPGLFPNVAVFDFRSLYPTIMLTFNIDPLAHERVIPDACTEKLIVAPNDAGFSRERGILPELIEGYFAARRRALDAGDDEASFVYKILMNSFYGVLGTSSCRYGRTELAGAITSFARKWLHFSRDWFTQAGYRVIYGDTDSLFVETGLTDTADYGDFLEWGRNHALKLNASLGMAVKDEYGLESSMELRFEKAYRRFMIPPLRGSGPGIEGRGRAKGYGGYLLVPEPAAGFSHKQSSPSGNSLTVEVKGMEAVRSDYTPLARRIQIELLELVFTGCGEANFKNRVQEILKKLRLGKLDDELVYRKRLSRNPETYTASTPPQVKAARALGWKNRRGAVEYVWTVNGPQPSSNENGQALSHAPLDYDHYAESQVLPAARSIAAAAGWNVDMLPSPGRDYFRDGQLELGL
ncbi:MAG: DNA polymerase II [Treponema sp.]|nr:DNA polymerase II [Treponema sp.]